MVSLPVFARPDVSPMLRPVIILDTDTVFLHTLKTHLQAKGCWVQAATKPDEIKLQPYSSPSLVLCDISIFLQYDAQMRSLLESKQFRHSTTIMMSWHSTLYDIRYAVKMGAQDCVAKSLSAEILAIALEARLQAKFR